MYKVHGYLDNKKIIDWRMEHLPRTGDTVRFAGEKYAKVTEVVWCMDEKSNEGQRVNVRMETETPNDCLKQENDALAARLAEAEALLREANEQIGLQDDWIDYGIKGRIDAWLNGAGE